MVSFFAHSPRDNVKLESGRLILEPINMNHYEPWAHLRAQSATFLRPWEPTWPADDLSRSAFRRRVKRYQRQSNKAGLAYLLFSKPDGVMVGGITVSRILRGVAQSCAIGYWIGEPFSRQGYMGEAVHCLLAELFFNLNFHRVEAACLPHNLASIGLLEKVGFKREGYAREYLKIDGIWRDHLLFSLIEHEFAKKENTLTS